MRVLLFSPSTVESITKITSIKTGFVSAIHKGKGVEPPIGLLYVASSIKENTDHEVNVVDLSIDRLSIEEIGEKIKGYDPDVIGLAMLTYSLPECIRIARLAKEINRRIKVIIGGIHVHLYPHETIGLGCFDYGILGEAEYSMVRILDKIEKNESPSDVKGVVYKENGSIIDTGPPDVIEDLDSLPFPDRTLLPYKRYKSVVARANPVNIMITSRGCPYSCVFCNKPQLGKHFRTRSADNVIDEFEECFRLGIREIMVYDETFTIDHQRVVDICKGLIERKVKMYWGIRARVDTVDEEMLSYLKKAGCVRIQYGVESGNPDTLKRLRKGITLEQAEKAFAITNKQGIDSLAYFMLGCPGETHHTVRETLEFAKKIKPTYVIFTLLLLFPSTTIYTHAVEKGLIKKDVWLEFASNPSDDFEIPMYEENFKRDELVRLLNKYNKIFYLRPSFIFRSLFKKRGISKFYIEAKMALNLFLKAFS